MTGSTTSSSLSDPSSHAMSAVRPVTVLVSDASRNERPVSPIVEARVADRLVPVVEVTVGDGVDSAEAFGDIITCEFDVNSARPCSFSAVGSYKTFDLCDHGVKVTGLSSVLGRECVAVHRVTCPDNGVPCVFHCTQ